MDVVVVLGNWKISENPQFEEIKGGTCAESVQQVSGECWRMWWDGLGRARRRRQGRGSDVVVDVVLVVLWKWKNEEIQEIPDFQNRK